MVHIIVIFDKSPYSHTLYKLIKPSIEYKVSIKTKGMPGLCAIDMKEN